MKNTKLGILVLMLCLWAIPGCSWLAVNLTPAPVMDAVARGGAVARIAETDGLSGDDLQAYLKVNRELWEELEIWFELREPTE